MSYPIAEFSAAAFYFAVTAMCVPAVRRSIAPFFSHPVSPQQRLLGGFDSIRGLAASLVALGHFWYFTNPVFSETQHKVTAAAYLLGYAYKAVPIFCALSGFLIYRSCLAIGNRNDLKQYAVRRFFRIYPVYLFGVLLCALFSQHISTQQALGEVLLFPILGWTGYSNWIMWSLYAEIIFYVTLPLTLLFIGRRCTIFLSCVLLISVILFDIEYRTFGIIKYFLFGILAFELSKLLRAGASFISFITGTLLCWLDFSGYDWGGRLGLANYAGHTVGLGLSCALILASLPTNRVVSNVLSLQPLRTLGIISYSLFIIHPFYLLANFPEIGLIAVAAPHPPEIFKTYSLMPAWYLPIVFFPGVIFWSATIFLLVERPGMKFGQWFNERWRQRSLTKRLDVLPARRG